MVKNSNEEKKPGNAEERAARKAANQAEREARKAERQAKRGEKKPKPEKTNDVKAKARKSGADQPKNEKRKVDAGLTDKASRQAERASRKEARQQAKVAHEAQELRKGPTASKFNILIVAQAGRLATQAVLFAESLRRFSPDFAGRLIVAEPQPEGAWAGKQTRLPEAIRSHLTQLGAEIRPFTAQYFGRDYPYGNKIEALEVLTEAEPFMFFDTDTLITGPLDRLPIDFEHPSASMRREGTWPVPPLYGPGFGDIWRSLYDRFGLDFESSLDLEQPDEHWERYLYFNAGWFFGPDPKSFRARFLDYALAVRAEPGEALASQSLDPWLDQVVLPLVVHSLGGGRPGPELAGLDGATTCHYRNLSLLYAREADATVAAFEELAARPEVQRFFQSDAGFTKLVTQGAGRAEACLLFAGKPLPQKEQAIRQALRKANLWFDK